jgi:hypothetical protein
VARLNLLACALGCQVAAAALVAAQGRIVNATIEARPIRGTVEREVQALGRTVAWIGYRTPMIPGRRQMCCDDSIAAVGTCCGMCRLEGGGGVTMTQGDAFDPRASRVVVEAAADLLVLARVENGAVTRLRIFTPDCDIDGGGIPIVWLEGVGAAESVAWLSGLARSAAAGRERENRVAQPAMSALALTPDSAALRALVAMAREDQRPGVRNQALFWLSQRAGQDAAAAIGNAIENDPDTDVKKRAVFALSQLPRDEGIPLLIQVARTNRNLEVRKQAMFWLGQSKDARAVQFFEEVLLRK